MGPKPLDIICISLYNMPLHFILYQYRLKTEKPEFRMKVSSPVI